MKIKNILTFLFVAFMGITSFSQNAEIKNKLKFHSFSITPLELFSAQNFEGGISGSVDVSLSINQNVFSFSASSSTGNTASIFDSEVYKQYNFLYGRETLLTSKLFFDAFAGVGSFNREWEQTDFEYTGIGFGFYSDKTREYNSTIGIPIVLKLRYIPKEIFNGS